MPHDVDLPGAREQLARMKEKLGAPPFFEYQAWNEHPTKEKAMSDHGQAVEEWRRLWEDLCFDASRIKACRALLTLLEFHKPARIGAESRLLVCGHCYAQNDPVGVQWPCRTFKAIQKTE